LPVSLCQRVDVTVFQDPGNFPTKTGLVNCLRLNFFLQQYRALIAKSLQVKGCLPKM
jgi:hypothetical protein